jgi:excinuclease UvrABC nuclease subunit
MVKGIGAVRLRALLDTFGDAQSAWLAPSESLVAVGLPRKIVDNLVKLRASVSLEEIW